MTTEPAWVCTECDTPLRPARKTATELPGTRPHATKGKCRPCYDREYRASRRDTRPALEPTRGRESIRENFDLDHAVYALNSWIANLPSRRTAA